MRGGGERETVGHRAHRPQLGDAERAQAIRIGARTRVHIKEVIVPCSERLCSSSAAGADSLI
jgi:hypothetical protein